MFKKIICYTLCLCFILSIGVFASYDYDEHIQQTADFLMDAVPSPSPGDVGGEWVIISLARSGAVVPTSYFQSYYQTVLDTLKQNDGVLSGHKYTEYSRVALALTAIGVNPRNVGGYDLLAPLADFDSVSKQGLNGAIWALIALDSANYAMPQFLDGTQATRQMYIDEIIAAELSGGGFSLTGQSPADSDITGMAITALLPYRDNADVSAIIDRAFARMSLMQGDDGSINAWGGHTSESLVQLIVALCSAGISPDEGDFVKSGGSLLSNFMSYSDGHSFAHLPGGDFNLMATEQGLYALASISRLQSGKNAIFDMSDKNASVNINSFTPLTDIDIPSVKTSVSFSDLANTPEKTAILQLASRGIVNGVGDGLFSPDLEVTRAEFCTMAVRALGFDTASNDAFSDVLPASWYAPYVGTAAAYGLVNGTGAGQFAPDSHITHEQAATMIMRMAELCGFDIALTDSEISATLGKLKDSYAISDYARQAMAFCYNAGIVSSEDGFANPDTFATRAQLADMIYNLIIQMD